MSEPEKAELKSMDVAEDKRKTDTLATMNVVYSFK